MKIHRFFLNNTLGEDIIIKDKELLHQWLNVLKFKKDDEFILFNNKEVFDYVYSIKNITKNEADILFLKKNKNILQKKEKNNVSLYISIIKKDNLDLIFEKCTEIGALKFTPIISDRTEKKNINSFNKDRGEKIIKEATEQSGWGNIPILNKVEHLKNAINNILKENEADNIYILDIESENIEYIKIKKNNTKNIHIFIGPEGGWTSRECEIFKKYNLKIVSFGKNTLRAETAAIISTFYFSKDY